MRRAVVQNSVPAASNSDRVSGALALNHVEPKGKPMQVPTILRGKRPFDLITGGVAGAILIIAVGFNWTGYGFGWMLRGTAEQLVIEAAVAAPIRPDPMQMMMNAKDLPTERYKDFSLVFD